MKRSDAARSDRPVRVAIDANFLRLPPSGIGTYVRCLIEALQADHEHLGVTLDVLHDAGPRLLRPGSRLHRFVWDTLGAGVSVTRRRPRPDVLHLPQMSAPIVSPVPTVVTIHDVIPLVLKEYRTSRSMQMYLALMARTARNARAIITPSQASADDIVRVLGVNPHRITVIPEAASPDLVPDQTGSSAQVVRERFGVEGQYLFNIGGLDIRKNVPMLVESFADAMPHLPPGISLVIAGAAHSSNTRMFPPIEPVVRARGLQGRVHLIGRVTDNERRALLQAALACVTPSMYEGFGLTPLEAMACGTPVIAANSSSFPEVVGAAGMLVPPERSELAEAMIQLAGCPELRRRLGAAGLERSRDFSWGKAAEATAAVYRSVAVRG
jgi:glycosyltransferase involved in cell wall biosynthesis